MQIKGNTFIVTGGASGLGEATVRHLVSLGANVAIFDLNKEGAEGIAKELGGQTFVPGEVDVTSEQIVREAVQNTVAKFGKLAGVINCGGVASAAVTARRGNSAHTMTMEIFEYTIRVNLLGTFNVCRQVSEVLVNQDPFTEAGERGIIINTASIAYQDGQKGQTAYSASKGGVAAMTLPMARDLANAGVRVNTIAPGVFATNMTSVMKDAVVKDALFPTGKGHPQDYASLVAFLIENGMMNGEVVRIDGGARLGKL
ncbi:NAD(P)-binding protein [Hesseltinella vesiculosa]|uniref:NAD(P)-binding protein n=1 Tax=Hesseltinella vesiculosa TaxID=101127 RepID=A0A1X2GYU9_9FUNG|nr:NAD(P)-binding protein [Hesseltinella vesiculosa]